MAISCDPQDLIAAASAYQKIPPQYVELVKIYLLAQKAGLGNLTAQQLIDLAKCNDCIPEGMWRAVEAALLCVATGGVPPCPPSGGGGCSYQDMQVAWAPSNLKLGELIGFAAYASGTLIGITDIVFNQATSSFGFDIESGDDLVSLSWPNLLSINNPSGGFYLQGLPNLVTASAPLLGVNTGNTNVTLCPKLVNLDLSSWIPGAGIWNFNDNALPSATINALLARGVSNAGFVVGGLNLSNQTPPAPPTGQGIADKATLIGRGLTVTTD